MGFQKNVTNCYAAIGRVIDVNARLKRGQQTLFHVYGSRKRQATAACASGPGIASLELRLI